MMLRKEPRGCGELGWRSPRCAGRTGRAKLLVRRRGPEEERARPGGFQRWLAGVGGPAADPGSTASGGKGAQSACPSLAQENWCSRNRAQGATSTKLCASKSKNTRPH